jgi:tetratricopeptide (TPR) repeat protein
MANLLRQEGNNQGAHEYYEKALDRDPPNTEALTGIVSILTEQGRRSEAIARVEQQLTETPKSDRAYLLLVGLKTARKDLPGSEGSLQNAVI